MKPEYIPPKEDVIVQNEAPDDANLRPVCHLRKSCPYLTKL